MTDLDWLTVDATVAFISGGGADPLRVYPAHVDVIGKRDVLVTVDGRTERFNITRIDRHHDNAWLYRRDGVWTPNKYLAPHDDPDVVKISEKYARHVALDRAVKCAGTFRGTSDVANARMLRDAVDEFLKIADPEHDYLSTYCWHENHGDCRRECKTCHRPCRCECHPDRQGLEPTTIRPATESAGGAGDGQDLAARLAHALKRAGDRQSSFQFREHAYWLPVAGQLLDDTELLDAIVAYRRPAHAEGGAGQ